MKFSVVIDVVNNDTDSDGTINPATVAITTQPGHGSLQVNATTGAVTYTPAANFFGADSFAYTVNDNDGLISNEALVSITINPVNDAPSFTTGADQTVLEDSGPQTVNPWATAISAGPADEAAQTLTFVVTGNTNPALFSVAPAISPTGVLTYTAAANANGAATITLVLNDNGGTANGGVDTSAAQTFVINVTPVVPVNNPPVALGDSAVTTLHTPALINVLANDSDDGALAPSSLTIGAGPTHGTVSVNSSTGTITYTPAFGFFGSDSFTYTVKDDQGVASNQATVNLTVNHNPTTPLAQLLADPNDGTKTALVVMGTTAKDTITLSIKKKTGAITVKVGKSSFGPFTPTGSIFIFGLGGHDKIKPPKTTLPVVINTDAPTGLSAVEQNSAEPAIETLQGDFTSDEDGIAGDQTTLAQSDTPSHKHRKDAGRRAGRRVG